MVPTREEKLNMRLAELLTRKGLTALGEEEQTGGRRIDVLVKIEGQRIAVEAKKGTLPRNREEAMSAAAGRLEDGLADAVVAVCYPDNLTVDRFNDGTSLWVSSLGGVWAETDVAGLAAIVRRTSDDLSDIEQASRTFRAALKVAAANLERNQVKDISGAVSIPLGSGQPSMRAALLVASACLFHARLDEAHARGEITKPRTDARTGGVYNGEGWPFSRLGDCLAFLDPVDTLSAAWDTILAVDYKPVFETALTVISAPTQNRGLTEFIRGCGYAALGAIRSLTGGQTDLLGRVFHLILDEAKNTGAFYTSAAAATLLAGIAIRDEDVTPDLDYQIVDPACGTGTLLAAAGSRVKEITQQHGKVSGRHLIEEVIHGYDIDIAATHMAAVTLGLMSPDVAFRKMNIHRFYLDVAHDKVSGGDITRAGSLELMASDGLAKIAGWPQPAKSGQVETGTEDDLAAGRKDLVIMNPPFTRNSLRHKHNPKIITNKLKDREKELFSGFPVNRSHYGGMFLILADRLCDESEGKVALVYPTASCGAPSAHPVWEYLLNGFELDVVITSHDLSRLYFSENTKINESLFVLRRSRDEDNKKRATRFIQLARNPSTPGEASLLAASLRGGKIPEKWGCEVTWPRERILDNDWTPVKFLSPYLTHTAQELFGTTTYGMVPLRDLAELGPDGRQIRGDVFTHHRRPDETGRRGIWYNNQEKPAKNGSDPKQTLRIEPDCYLHYNLKDRQKADRLWSRGGRLLLPSRFSSSARTFAITSPEKVLGSAWITVKSINAVKGWEEAMVVYLNSTIGVLAQIRVSSMHSLHRPHMSIAAINQISLPKMTDHQISLLASVYEDICDRPLDRLTYAENDSIRIQLDDAVSNTLGIPQQQANKLRAELTSEPSITGH